MAAEPTPIRRTQDTAQLAMDERQVTDADLEAVLERRLKAHDDMAEVRGVFTRADTEARAMVDKLDLELDEAIRVGRFRIARTMRRGRSVSFDTQDKERVSIKLIEAE
jgi:hypothetical protein